MEPSEPNGLLDCRGRIVPGTYLAGAVCDADVGPNGVHNVDRVRFARLPRARHEGIRLGCQRTHRTKVDHVARQLRQEHLLDVRTDLYVGVQSSQTVTYSFQTHHFPLPVALAWPTIANQSLADSSSLYQKNRSINPTSNR